MKSSSTKERKVSTMPSGCPSHIFEAFSLPSTKFLHEPAAKSKYNSSLYTSWHRFHAVANISGVTSVSGVYAFARTIFWNYETMYFSLRLVGIVKFRIGYLNSNRLCMIDLICWMETTGSYFILMLDYVVSDMYVCSPDPKQNQQADTPNSLCSPTTVKSNITWHAMEYICRWNIIADQAISSIPS